MPAKRSRRKVPRPPKSFLKRCAAHVKAAARRARKAIRNPVAVCSGNWYHKMTPASRGRAKRKYRD